MSTAPPQGHLIDPDPPWPPPWARSVAFVFGLTLMGWEAVIDQSAHLVAYGPAFACTGLPIAKGVENLLDKLMGLVGKSSPSPEPPPPPPPLPPVEPEPKAKPRRKRKAVEPELKEGA